MIEPMRIESDRRYRAIVVGLLLVFAASFFYYALASQQADPDTFWHIATGRYIVSHRVIPMADVFSWYGIEHDLSWLPQSWLFGVVAYAVWLIGGFRLLYVATALVGAATVGLVYCLFARRSGNRLLAITASVLCAWGLSPLIAPRPQMLTYLLLVGLALLLEHKKWWWAVPVVLLGVNVHGPIYPVYLAVVAYYTLPRRWPVLAACTAAVLATPSGLALLPYPFLSILGTGSSPVQEFVPVAPIEWPAYLIALLVILLLLNRQAIRLRDLTGLLLLVVVSLTASRHMVFMYLLALPLAAPYLELPSERRARAVGASSGAPSDDRTARSVRAIGTARGATVVRLLDWALVGVLVAGALFRIASALTLPVDPSRGYPEQASRYLQTHGITRYFNEWDDGGFLILSGMNPLIDGRAEQYFPYPGRRRVTMGAEYLEVWYLAADCRPFLARNGISHLLLRRSSPLTRVLEQSPAFREVYSDNTFIVYERSASATSAL